MTVGCVLGSLVDPLGPPDKAYYVRLCRYSYYPNNTTAAPATGVECIALQTLDATNNQNATDTFTHPALSYYGTMSNDTAFLTLNQGDWTAINTTGAANFWRFTNYTAMQTPAMLRIKDTSGNTGATVSTIRHAARNYANAMQGTCIELIASDGKQVLWTHTFGTTGSIKGPVTSWVNPDNSGSKTNYVTLTPK